MFRHFARDESGNIMILTAIMAMPILLLVAGVVDTTRHTRMQRVMQSSTDAAVLAAFHSSQAGWGNRQKTAHRYFRFNARNVKFPNGVRVKMTREIKQNHLIYTYKATTRVDQLFGKLSPFSGEKISATSRAAWRMRSREHARLIGNSDGKSQQGGS